MLTLSKIKIPPLEFDRAIHCINMCSVDREHAIISDGREYLALATTSAEHDTPNVAIPTTYSQQCSEI